MLMHIRDAYVRGRGTYGSPRVTAELKSKGIPCGKNRVARSDEEQWDQGKDKAQIQGNEENPSMTFW